jgi:hypothetical protein
MRCCNHPAIYNEIVRVAAQGDNFDLLNPHAGIRAMFSEMDIGKKKALAGRARHCFATFLTADHACDRPPT